MEGFPLKMLEFWSMKYENAPTCSNMFHQKQKNTQAIWPKKRKNARFLIQVVNFQDTLEVMNNLAKLLQVPWMAGCCILCFWCFLGPYEPFGTKKVQVYSVYLCNKHINIVVLYFSCICCRQYVVSPIRISCYIYYPQNQPPSSPFFSISCDLQGARQNGGSGAYLSACLGRLWREVGCTTSAYLDVDEQSGRLGKTGSWREVMWW